MSIAVGMDDVYEGESVNASEAGPPSKRIVVGYGFWIFLLSDIVMFSALFASYAVLSKATAGGPTGAQLFSQQNAAIEPAFLLLSSYTCGLLSLAAHSPLLCRGWFGGTATFECVYLAGSHGGSARDVGFPSCRGAPHVVLRPVL